MKKKGNRFSTKLTMTRLIMSQSWNRRDKDLRVSLMNSKRRMLNLYGTKKLFKGKFFLPQISYKQSNSNAMRPSSNLWSFLKL